MPKRRHARQDNSERAQSIRQLETLIEQGAQRMHQAVIDNNPQQFERAAKAWTQTQCLWLQTTQQLPVEQAKKVLLDFMNEGDLAHWAQEFGPGLPPSILTRYPPQHKEEKP